jgi:hypothetical protein
VEGCGLGAEDIEVQSSGSRVRSKYLQVQVEDTKTLMKMLIMMPSKMLMKMLIMMLMTQRSSGHHRRAVIFT